MPKPDGVTLPLNLGLNDGTYMPESCIEVLREHLTRTSLRNYTSPDNDPLRDAIAAVDGVRPEHIFLRNGSGPILKQVVPHLIRSEIKASPYRIAKHLVNKNGYPIITPWFTYSKVPKKAAGLGLTVHLLPMGPENGFQIDVEEIDRRLQGGDGLVYIANPNNPTGNVLVTREQMEPLFKKYPKSWFWIDEAYVQYVDPNKHQYFSDLVPKYDNLIVGRTFSFAYGMAGVRIGYMLANPGLVKEMDGQITNYRLGTLPEALGVAAVNDPDHLPWLREECERQRSFIRQSLADLDCIELYDSETNFVFGRILDGRTGDWLKAEMKKRGILIKSLAPLAQASYEPYFRLTLGTEEENRWLVEELRAVLTA